MIIYQPTLLKAVKSQTITSQITINSNRFQINNRFQIKSCASKSNIMTVKSNHHMWFNRDSNQIMIWICPSLIITLSSLPLVA